MTRRQAIVACSLLVVVCAAAYGMVLISAQSCGVGTLWVKKVSDPATNPMGEKRDDSVVRHLMFRDELGSCSVGATPGCDRRLHAYVNRSAVKHLIVSKFQCEER